MKRYIATIEDLDSLYEFFNIVIDHQPLDEYGADWTKDVYPSYEILKDKIINDLFFIEKKDDQIIAAGAVQLHEEEDYKKGKWLKNYMDDEIAVLHLFAIHPDFRGKGIAKAFLRFIIDETGKYVKTIHLDVVKGNLPARITYEKAGFILVDEIEMYYEDTGNIFVELLEYDY